MEQYLEHLGTPDDEAKVKVATQFLTKNTKMWWRRKFDQISNGDVDDISTWDDMIKALQTHFSPQDETWDARMNIKYIIQGV